MSTHTTNLMSQVKSQEVLTRPNADAIYRESALSNTGTDRNPSLRNHATTKLNAQTSTMIQEQTFSTPTSEPGSIRNP